MVEGLRVDQRVRVLQIGFVGLFVLVLGFMCLSLHSPAQGAPSPGTCLPLSKGGTGCDTLPISSGGTGATTAYDALRALAMPNITNPPYFVTFDSTAPGTSGYSNTQQVRNALGLGNTTGALPIANGGTGGTGVLQAANNLAFESFLLANPIANNTNLNSITTPGMYGAGDSSTLTNVPFTTGSTIALLLKVELTYRTSSASANAMFILQTVYQHNQAHQRYWQRFSSNTGSTWSSWMMWSSNDIYSTTEQDTGKTWIDGKIIYRRVFTGTITAAANSYGQVNLLNVAAIVAKGGMWLYNSSGSSWIGLGDNDASSIYSYIHHTRPNGVATFATFSTAARTNAPYEVWIEYTK